MCRENWSNSSNLTSFSTIDQTTDVISIQQQRHVSHSHLTIGQVKYDYDTLNEKKLLVVIYQKKITARLINIYPTNRLPNVTILWS